MIEKKVLLTAQFKSISFKANAIINSLINIKLSIYYICADILRVPVSCSITHLTSNAFKIFEVINTYIIFFFKLNTQ